MNQKAHVACDFKRVRKWRTSSRRSQAIRPTLRTP